MSLVGRAHVHCPAVSVQQCSVPIGSIKEGVPRIIAGVCQNLHDASAGEQSPVRGHSWDGVGNIGSPSSGPALDVELSMCASALQPGMR